MAEVQQPVPPSDIPPEEWEHLRTLLVFYFSHRFAHDPEDLAQIVLQRVWEKLTKGLQIEGKDGLVKYSYTVAAFVRKEQLKTRQTEQLKDTFAAPMPNTQGLNTMETTRLVRQILEQLPGAGGELIWDAETMDHDEAAKKKHTSVANYRVMVSRARDKFRRAVGLRGG